MQTCREQEIGILNCNTFFINFLIVTAYVCEILILSKNIFLNIFDTQYLISVLKAFLPFMNIHSLKKDILEIQFNKKSTKCFQFKFVCKKHIFQAFYEIAHHIKRCVRELPFS